HAVGAGRLRLAGQLGAGVVVLREHLGAVTVDGQVAGGRAHEPRAAVRIAVGDRGQPQVDRAALGAGVAEGRVLVLPDLRGQRAVGPGVPDLGPALIDRRG